MPPPGNLPVPLTLEDLSEGIPHIPPECGTVLAQSAGLCLEGQGHKSGVLLTVQGSFNTSFRLAQTERSDPSGLTAFVAGGEFGRPAARVIRR
jgi:hypothetical protein